YHENGKLQQIGDYIEDERAGTWNEYYDKGQVRSNGTYDKNGKPIGTWKRFYENGKVEEIATYDEYGRQSDKLNYYKNGQVSFSGKWVNGAPAGEWISYHENGQLRD